MIDRYKAAELVALIAAIISGVATATHVRAPNATELNPLYEMLAGASSWSVWAMLSVGGVIVAYATLDLLRRGQPFGEYTDAVALTYAWAGAIAITADAINNLAQLHAADLLDTLFISPLAADVAAACALIAVVGGARRMVCAALRRTPKNRPSLHVDKRAVYPLGVALLIMLSAITAPMVLAATTPQYGDTVSRPDDDVTSNTYRVKGQITTNVQSRGINIEISSKTDPSSASSTAVYIHLHQNGETGPLVANKSVNGITAGEDYDLINDSQLSADTYYVEVMGEDGYAVEGAGYNSSVSSSTVGTDIQMDTTIKGIKRASIIESVSTTYNISGTVTDYKGDPVSGATVTLDSGASVTTDSGGNYSIAANDSETHTVTVSVSGYADASADVTISGSAVTKDFTLQGNDGPYWVNGTVKSNKTSDPLNGANVNISNGSQTFSQDLSDAQGDFAIHVPKTGTYDITAEEIGYYSKTISHIVDAKETSPTIKLNPLNTPTPSPTPTPEPNPEHTLSGQVVDENGDPVDSAWIQLTNKTSGNTLPLYQADSNGFYSITADQTEYDVEASKSGYGNQTKTITLDTDRSLDFELNSTADDATPTPDDTPTDTPSADEYTLSGQVVDENGNPIDSPWIQLTDQSTGDTLPLRQADPNGIYSITVENGTYDVEASKSGYGNQVKSVTLDADTSLGFTLLSSGDGETPTPNPTTTTTDDGGGGGGGSIIGGDSGMGIAVILALVLGMILLSRGGNNRGSPRRPGR
jgi:protocatechuate 3,4-dioxygenase beta subunit